MAHLSLANRRLPELLVVPPGPINLCFLHEWVQSLSATSAWLNAKALVKRDGGEQSAKVPYLCKHSPYFRAVANVMCGQGVKNVACAAKKWTIIVYAFI